MWNGKMVFFRIFDQNWPILTKMTIWDPPVNQPNIDFQKKWFWYSFFTPKKYSRKKVLILICEKKPICSPLFIMYTLKMRPFYLRNWSFPYSAYLQYVQTREFSPINSRVWRLTAGQWEKSFWNKLVNQCSALQVWTKLIYNVHAENEAFLLEKLEFSVLSLLTVCSNEGIFDNKPSCMAFNCRSMGEKFLK